MVELGDRVKDKITGFSGIVIAKAEWITGCVRIGVLPEKSEGSLPEPEWIDEVYLEILNKKVFQPNIQKVNENPAGPVKDDCRKEVRKIKLFSKVK